MMLQATWEAAKGAVAELRQPPRGRSQPVLWRDGRHGLAAATIAAAVATAAGVVAAAAAAAAAASAAAAAASAAAASAAAE
eukprot:4051902-Heterocapsa_arctica.AAC.1